MSRRRMKNDASQRPTKVKASISRAQSTMTQDVSPVTRPRTRAAAGVSGSAHEAVRTASGNRSNGKKIPLTQNMGRVESQEVV